MNLFIFFILKEKLFTSFSTLVTIGEFDILGWIVHYSMKWSDISVKLLR